MVESRSPGNLDQIQRGVEQALNVYSLPDQYAEPRRGGSQLPSITAAERIERIGNVSARAITEACETTARDIEQAGKSAVEIAAEIMREAEELSNGLRNNGKRISEHLQEFATLARRVSTTMRDTRAEVLNPAADKRLEIAEAPPIGST
jgi:hypothetical protein